MIILALLIGSLVVYSLVYFNTKNKLEDNFTKHLKENDFYKNRNGYYSMNYEDGIVYSVPNQSMPNLWEFELDFRHENLYCNIDLENTYVEIIWEGNNNFSASAVSKFENRTVGSTSSFKKADFADMDKLGNELGLSKKEISKIISKGNELYKDFYLE